MNHPPVSSRFQHPSVSPSHCLWVLIVGLLGAFSLEASVYVQQMTLETLCARAHRIVRGTVVAVTEGQIKAGGGLLPTVTYKIKVKDTMAGKAAEEVNFTMIADAKAPARQGGVRRLPILEMPALEEGKEYLLFATKPSAVGLTSPVGLAQGCFAINKKGDTEFAVNGANNVGLGLGADGPVEYDKLTQRIRALRPN